MKIGQLLLGNPEGVGQSISKKNLKNRKNAGLLQL
jgi:hypothetical protein